jgi:hypothetical protein
MSLFVYLGAALVLYFGFGYGGVLGNGVPGSHSQLVETPTPAAGAAAKATYQGVADSSA